jgi:dihydrodipicolinate synthase/N-acetylneuraminate lyase
VTTPPPFTGVGVALVTLFDEDLGVAAEATADLAASIVGAGVGTVVVAGSTGEAAALEPAERTALLDAVVAAVRPLGASVVAGTGAPSTRTALALTAAAIDHGADAVLALSPPGGDPRGYYEAVAETAGGVPVLAYHYPAVSPPGIPVEALADLPVAGCKDSTGDADRLLETINTWDGNLYVGSSALVSLAGSLGLPGCILALANAEPERCVRAFAGDGGAQGELAAAHTSMRTGGFPAGIKGLTADRWGTSIAARMG